MSNSNYLYPRPEQSARRSVPDPELQILFEGCSASLVYAFCNHFNIDIEYYEDETGIRIFMYKDQSPENTNLSYFSPDKGFTYYVYYTCYREELVNKFTKFKNLKAFL